MTLSQPNSTLLSIKYYPDGDTLIENPARFTWMPEGCDDHTYCLEVSAHADFTGNVIRKHNIPYNFYTLDQPLAPGTYYWRYSLEGEMPEPTAPNTYSICRSFTVADALPQTPLKSRSERYNNASNEHPRLWLNKTEVEAFQKALQEDNNYCGFAAFYDNAVREALAHQIMEEPAPYPDNKRQIALWRQSYMDCQRALCTVRALSIAGVLLQDSDLLAKAKQALLQVADFSVDGTTSRDYNDESAFRIAAALAFGFDWLYDTLTQQEREMVLDRLFVRTKQVADHVIQHSRIHYSLYDSHAVRSLSSVLTPCCIAMHHHKPQAADWLDYTIEYFSAIYTPWGGEDGGWAEGPMYWTTGMAFVIDALNLIKNYTQIDLYQRPFFQKTGDFILHCNPVDTYRASFCDQSNLGELPGIKTAFNMRQFGAVTNNPAYIWYYEQIKQRSSLNPGDFFNKGWWDLYFDEMVFLHDYGRQSAIAPSDAMSCKPFFDIGWVSINKHMADFDHHILLLTKSSPYGCVSHSHGDQNEILLFAYGEALLIKSGYYIGFHSSMHMDYRRQTHSHNAILIDGVGQYAGMEKPKQLSAKGEVISVQHQPDHICITADATQAYALTVPYLQKWERQIYFVQESYVILVDVVKLSQEGVVNFLLHGLHPFEIEQQSNAFVLQGDKAQLVGSFVYSAGGIDSITQTNEFVGVNPAEVEGLEVQYHLTANTKKAKSHLLITLLEPLKVSQKPSVHAIKDDQGHDLFFYFDHQGHTFTLRIDGNARYDA